MVPRRARHADERGARGDPPASRGSPREARRARRGADRPLEAGLVHVRRLEGHGLRGRHPRVGGLRLGQAGLLALVQVPPPARPPLLFGSLPELPDDGRRRAERAGLHRADPRGRCRRGPERPLVARLRLHVRHGQDRRAVHARRLLLPHVHPPAGARGRCTRSSCEAQPVSGSSTRTRDIRAATTPSTARLACSSSEAARRAARLRSRRRRKGLGSCWWTRTRGCRALAAGVDVLAPASALGIWEGGLVPVDAGSILYRFRAERIVVATGATEQPVVFPGNDLVGVMLPDGVRRLVRDFSIRPGERAIVLGADDETLAIAGELDEIGTEIVRSSTSATSSRASWSRRAARVASAAFCSTASGTPATSSWRPAGGSLRTRSSHRRERGSSGTTRSASSCRPSFPTVSRPSAA